MLLSAEQFSQILSTLRSDAIFGRDSEHRTAPRVGLRMKATITCRTASGSNVRRNVSIRDISIRGIGLVASVPMEPAGYFVIVFRGHAESISVLYRVVRCSVTTDKQYLVGARFDRYLGPNAKN